MRLKLQLALFIGFISTTLVGNAYAKPSYPMDCSMCHIAPTVTNFELPPSHDALTVPITAFSATDTDDRVSGLARVSGYLLTTTPAAPSAGGPGWKNSPPAEYSFAADGLQTLYAWAKDAVGIISEVASAAVDISIFVNTPPVADAGPDQTVDEGVSVTLNGSNSDDSDNGIKSFFWEPVGGSNTIALSDPSAEQPTFNAPDVGPGGSAFTFRLTITDYSDAVSTDTCIVNISWVNIAPVADAGSDQTVTEGTPVTLNGGASDGVDDAIDSYLWEQVTDAGATAALSDPTAVNPSFTVSDVGPNGQALTFQLTVTDQGGLQATDLCVINVTNVNQAPVADAGSDQSVLTGVEVSLDASNSHDPDGDALSITWKQIDGTPVTLTAPSASAPAFIAPTTVAAGTSETLTFELTVTDAGLLKATDICHIEVNGEELPPVEEPPVVEPPVVEPPVVEPPVVEPPVVEPPMVEPPVVEPPVVEPPVVEPPVVEPPVVEPPVVEPPVVEPPVVEPPVVEPPAACGDDALLKMKKYKRLSDKYKDRAKAFEKKSERLKKASERTKYKKGKRAKTLKAKAIKMKRLSKRSEQKAEQFKEKYEALKSCVDNGDEDDDHEDDESDEDHEKHEGREDHENDEDDEDDD